jgi:hypothetical protein
VRGRDIYPPTQKRMLGRGSTRLTFWGETFLNCVARRLCDDLRSSRRIGRFLASAELTSELSFSTRSTTYD